MQSLLHAGDLGSVLVKVAFFVSMLRIDVS